MDIVILENKQQVAGVAVQHFQRQLKAKPGSVFGLATGRTPLALYKLLAAKVKTRDLSFRHATSFNLDEYYGLGPNHPLSYRAYMQREFFDHVDFQADKTYLPECEPDEDPVCAAHRYERQIQESGGIDLQLLGLGKNGHIGFNEPSSSLGSRTRIKTLTRETLATNQSADKPVQALPELAITVGVATIMDAKKILMLACGTEKAAAVHYLVEGGISARWPATILQMHERVTLIVDEAASGQLQMREYYLQTQRQKHLLSGRFGDDSVFVEAGR